MNSDNFSLVSLSHRTISTALLDAVTVDVEQRESFLSRLRSQGLTEIMALFTSGRVEFWGMTHDPSAMAALIYKELSQYTKMTEATLSDCMTLLHGKEAVTHGFMVATSMDSVVLGDPYLIPQIKSAKMLAEQAGTYGIHLAQVVETALRVAERVHKETAIGDGSVSIVAAAVSLAHDIHGKLQDCHGLLIGDGRMGVLLMEALQDSGLGQVTVTAPTQEGRERVAQNLDAHCGDFNALDDLLIKADIVVSALGERNFTITKPLVKNTLKMRRRRPVYLVDMAIPGDIDLAINGLEDAFLYDLSDLEKLVQISRSSREQAAQSALSLVNAEIELFCQEKRKDSYNSIPQQWQAIRLAVLSEHSGDVARATEVLLEEIWAIQEAKD